MASCHSYQGTKASDRTKAIRSVQAVPSDLDVKPYLILLPNELQTQICTYLPTASLAKLARACSMLGDNASRVLYLRNAEEENSTAVKYAILSTTKKLGEKFAKSIIHKAIAYGAQLDAVHCHPTKPRTYATALHMASALGHRSIVKLLLRNGASVKSPSRNLWGMIPFTQDQRDRILQTAAPCLTNTREWCPRKVRSDLSEVEWLPSFVPFLLQDQAIICLLFDKATDCRLTSDFKSHGCGALTALHIISASEKYGERLVRKVLQLSENLMDEKLPGDGGSALHVALRRKNAMFSKLVHAQVDLNLQTCDLGHTPIHAALTCCYEAEAPGDRKIYQDFIEELLEKGADVNKTTHLEGYTPLMTLVEAAEWDWNLSYRNMKHLVDLFIAKRCRINHMATSGETFVHLLIKRIAEKKGNHSLEGILEKVIKLGAQLNVPLPNSKSIAKAYVIDPEKPSKLGKILTSGGAIIDDREVDNVFLKWFKNTPIRNRYEMIKHKSQISQDAIDQAYLYAFEESSLKLVNELRKTWDFWPCNAEDLVWEALRDPGRKLMEFVLGLEFDAKQIHHQSYGSYLHHIVRQIQEKHYTERVAMLNAKALIDRGASTLGKDKEGKEVMDRIKEKEVKLKQTLDRLRLLIFDQRYEEEQVLHSPSEDRVIDER